MANLKVTESNFSKLLIDSVKEAKDHAQGLITLNSESLTLPDEPPKYSKTKIKKIRKLLNVSQAVFAKILNVSVQTVRAWEQGDNVPKGTTTRLLQIIEKDPRYFLETINEKESA